MSAIFTRTFWTAAADRAIRSAAQGFLVGSGVGSAAGSFAVLSVETLVAGLAGAASMALLSVVSTLAFPPGE